MRGIEQDIRLMCLIDEGPELQKGQGSVRPKRDKTRGISRLQTGYQVLFMNRCE
jgi:hypothetical protein